jgi:LysM repeat protein
MKKIILSILIGSLLLLTGTQVAWAAPAASCQTIHVVQPGETLSHIALHYETTVQTLATLNGIVNPNRIYAGQRLTVPCGATPPSGGVWYVVRRGDTLSSIAWRHGVNVWAIVRANPNIANPNRIYAGQRIYVPGTTTPPPGGVWYTVRWGDTLSSIAWRHGVSVWAIVQANDIANPNWIYTGQKLYIP